MKFILLFILFYLSLSMTNCTPSTLFASLEFHCDEVDTIEGVSCEESDELNNVGRLIRTRTRLDKIDILFVMDNSGSMRDEQRAMANQFDSFLEDIRDFDYQIAIITTDWISGKGQFLTFPNKETILSNPKNKSSVHRENVSLFQKTISPPTSSTGDHERGIQAINHALNRDEQDDFFRPHSLFILVIVTDADNDQTPREGVEHYDEDYDEPETLFKRISRKHKFSAVVVHSIISDPENPCTATQEKAGEVYARASHPPLKIRKKYGNVLTGEIGSICALNYGSQLGSIADYTIRNRLLPLSCYPIPNSISLKVNGRKVGFTPKGRKLLINKKIPFNAEAELSYRCPTK